MEADTSLTQTKAPRVWSLLYHLYPQQQFQAAYLLQTPQLSRLPLQILASLSLPTGPQMTCGHESQSGPSEDQALSPAAPSKPPHITPSFSIKTTKTSMPEKPSSQNPSKLLLSYLRKAAICVDLALRQHFRISTVCN